MEISLAQFGHVLFYAPAGLLVYLSREWVRSSLAQKLNGEESGDIILETDLFALVCWSFSGIGWGSFCRPARRDTLLTFMVAQLWFLALIAISIFYSRAKGLEAETFMATFFSAVIFISWTGFWLNWIPLPPFDAAGFYLKPLYAVRFISVAIAIWKVAIVIFFTVAVRLPEFFRGKFLLSWAGLS